MRPALLAGAAVVCLIAVPGAAPALACDAVTHARAVHRGHHMGVAPLMIGDSTAIFAAPILGRHGVEADAKGCRQFDDGTSLIAARPRHLLPDAVVFALGANGAVARPQIARASRVLGDRRFLLLVTSKNQSGATMRAAARAHPDRVLTLDWAHYSAGHGSWFGGDDLHVNYVGAHAYASFIREGLAPFLGPPHGGWPLDLPYRADAKRAKPCGRTRAYGRTIDVSLTRGADEVSCEFARRLMRGPRLHPPPRWRYYDWRTVGKGPWTDVLARRDRSIVVAGIARPGG